MRTIAWEDTPIGAVADWPQSLRTIVGIMLASRFAMRVIWGPEFIFLYNDSYRPVLGESKHPSAMGSRTEESFAEVWSIVGPMFYRVYAGESIALEDTLLPLLRNGYLEECYFTLSYSPIRDEQGVIRGLLGVVHETTERVLAERRLRTLRELASSAVAASTTVQACQRAGQALVRNQADVPFALFYLVDPASGEARLVNATGLEAHGLASPSRIAIGASNDEAGWPLARSAERRTLEVVSDVARRFGAIEAGPYPEPITSALVLPLLRAGVDRPYGFLIAGLNPRRALDDKYQGFFELASEHVVASINNVLAHQEERRRAEVLAELNRQKTAFFSNVSHEFRTPLTLLLGPLEDALASPQRALSGADLVAAHSNARRLLKLVNSLLDVSRIEAGRITANFEATDLGAYTRDLAASFRSLIEKGGLTLRVACHEGMEHAFVDRAMWEKIVLNLISNAFKFTFEGEVHVAVSRRPDGFELVVRDTGIGIAAADMARLFERYHRVEGARSRNYEGSGIGLALVHELVKLHGGTVDVVSELGRGTTFTVRIPAGFAHLPAEHVVHEVASIPPPVDASFVAEAASWLPPPIDAFPVAVLQVSGAEKRARILVADDNADMRGYIARLLQDRWQVACVSNGAAALEAIFADPPDLVLSDVMMPELDGFGLVQALRADPRTRALPVILLSARAGEEATAEGLGSGANDYLVKPFSARELLVRVASQLALSRVAHETARASEAERARLYALFMQAPMPVAIFRGLELRVELCNDVALATWGKTRAIVGLSLFDAFPELRGQRFDTLLRDVLVTGVPYRAHESLVRLLRGGDQLDDVYMTFVYAPLREANGEVDAVLVCGFEVTEQVVARQRVELLAGELVEQKRALESAQLLKDEFLATMSHELRTPLNAILGWARLLRSNSVDADKLPRALETIERNAVAQTRLIEDLLDVSRIITGKLRLSVGTVDLPQLLEKTIETLRPQADAKGVHIQALFDSDAGSVMGDTDRLTQVASNLLSNAIKFTPKGGRVELRLESVHSALRLTVRDDGAGIPAAFLPFVFDRFRQADQAITRRYGGIGLGLSIVKHLVELHGGTIVADSAGEGLGATFVVTLPVAAARYDPPTHAAPAQMAVPLGLEGLRVLAVDDERDARDLMTAILSHAGIEVRTAENAEAALRELTRFRPHVLVCDVGMPGEDGYAFMQRVRALSAEDGGRIRAVAVTAYARGEDRRRALSAGFNLHLAKPVDPSELLAAIASLAERYTPAPTAR